MKIRTKIILWQCFFDLPFLVVLILPLLNYRLNIYFVVLIISTAVAAIGMWKFNPNKY
jgi:hypothetical protein